MEAPETHVSDFVDLIYLARVGCTFIFIYLLKLFYSVCRKALANALAVAPSMWTLGNAGMGALQV